MSLVPRSKVYNTKDIGLPQKLFKYTEAQYVADFISGKCVWLGRLNDYRDIEKHQLLKGDPMEGRLDIKHEGVLSRSDPAQAPLHNFLGPNRHIEGTFTGCGAAISVNAPDCHVLCLSNSLGPEITAQLDPKYDACIEIRGVKQFLGQLCKAYGDWFESDKVSMKHRPVIYTPRTVLATGNKFSNSGFEKDIWFQEQDEYRVLWHNTPPIEITPFGLEANLSNVEMIVHTLNKEVAPLRP